MICTSIKLVTVRVKVKNEKADLEQYRTAGTLVFETCDELGAVRERTSFRQPLVVIIVIVVDQRRERGSGE